MATTWKNTLQEMNMTPEEIAKRRSRRRRLKLTVVLVLLVTTATILIGRWYYHRVVMQQRLETFSNDLIGNIEAMRSDYPNDWSLDRVLHTDRAVAQRLFESLEPVTESYNALINVSYPDEAESLRQAWLCIFRTPDSACIEGLFATLNELRATHGMSPSKLQIHATSREKPPTFVTLSSPYAQSEFSRNMPSVWPTEKGIVVLWPHNGNLSQQHVGYDGAVSARTELNKPNGVLFWPRVSVTHDSSILAIGEDGDFKQTVLAKFAPNQATATHTKILKKQGFRVWRSADGDVLEMNGDCFAIESDLQIAPMPSCPSGTYTDLSGSLSAKTFQFSNGHTFQIKPSFSNGLYTRVSTRDGTTTMYERIVDLKQPIMNSTIRTVHVSTSGQVVVSVYPYNSPTKELRLTFSTDYGQTWFQN